MPDGYQKEVRYDIYCSKCEHEKKHESEEPCNECLSMPGRDDSHKPERWEPKKSRR